MNEIELLKAQLAQARQQIADKDKTLAELKKLLIEIFGDTINEILYNI